MPQHALSRRRFLQAGAAAFSLALVPRAFAQSSKNPVVMRALVMSDVHFEGGRHDPEPERFKRAIQFVYDYSGRQAYKGFDALVVAGDMSNVGSEEQLALFKETMDAALQPGTQPLLCMGNHEFYGGDTARWTRIMGVNPNARYEINGVQFIALSLADGSCLNGSYRYALGWLEKELKAARDADPLKPIFVFQHLPITGTVTGGRAPDNWGVDDLYDLFQGYPQIVDFSGHTHFPITDPRSIWQGSFTALQTSSMSYICHEDKYFYSYESDGLNYGECYLLEVRADNSSLLTPMNVAQNQFYDFSYELAAPGPDAPRPYSDARYFETEEADWDWRRNKPIVEVVETFDDGARLRFPQATFRSAPFGYMAQISEHSEIPSKSYDPQYFHAQYYERPIPSDAYVNIDGLEPGKTYRALIKPINCYQRVSSKSAECFFEVPAARPIGAQGNPDVLDLSILEGRFTDQAAPAAPAPIPCQYFGSPRTVVDEELDACVLELDGRKSVAVSHGKPINARRLYRGTFVARFKAFEKTEESDPFCALLGNTNPKGAELYVNTQEKTVLFRFSVNDGEYQSIGAPISFGRWTDVAAVYNEQCAILYVNGEEVARTEAPGALTRFPHHVVSAYTVGADVEPGGHKRRSFKGRVAFAKVYSWPLSAVQIAELATK